MLNPEQSQDEDDNVVVTDDAEKQLENEEVLGRRGGRTGQADMVCSGEELYTSHPHPQDKSSESEDNKNSESEEDSTEEESDEEDRDGDVDPGFREQLMAVLQAGKALVSHSWGPRPCLSARAHEARLLTASSLRVAWTTTTRSWGMRP